MKCIHLQVLTNSFTQQVHIYVCMHTCLLVCLSLNHFNTIAFPQLMTQNPKSYISFIFLVLVRMMATTFFCQVILLNWTKSILQCRVPFLFGGASAVVCAYDGVLGFILLCYLFLCYFLPNCVAHHAFPQAL